MSSMQEIYGSMSYLGGASSHVDMNINDELMISNMINALNNPIISSSLNDGEKKILCEVIKRHVMIKAGMALESQERYDNIPSKTR